MTLRNDILELLREYGPLSSSEIIERTCIDGSEHSNRNKTNACLKKMVDDNEIYISGYLQHGIAVYSLANQLKSCPFWELCPFCGKQVDIKRNSEGLVEVKHIEDNDCIMNVLKSEWWGDIGPFIEQWNRRA